MSEEKEKKKNELHITKEWTIAFLILIGAMIAVYVMRVKPKDTTLKQGLLNISALIPLFTYVSSVLTEIGEGIVMIAKALYDNWREKKEKERERELEDARLAGEQKMYNQWVEWADNGREESARPRPPQSSEKS